MANCRDHRVTLLALILKKKGVLSSEDLENIENYVDIVSLLDSKGFFSKEERSYVEKASDIVKSRRSSLRSISQKIAALEALNLPSSLHDYHKAYIKILRGLEKKYA